MQLKSIGELFISRNLQLNDKNPTEVLIRIGKPQPFPEEVDYYCPFQIIGLGDEEVDWSGGIDEIQALLLALEKVGSILNNSKEFKDGKLSWLGSDKGNLGFPHLDSSGMLKHFS